jgi:hypothetical protein
MADSADSLIEQHADVQKQLARSILAGMKSIKPRAVPSDRDLQQGAGVNSDELTGDVTGLF